jgi:RecB family exonuclease
MRALLEAVDAQTRAGDATPIRVLCRSAATRNSLRAELSRIRPALLGVDIVTLDAAFHEELAHVRAGLRPADRAAVPVNARWSSLTEGRPRLRSLLRQRATEAAAILRMEGPSSVPAVPPDLRHLAEEGWHDEGRARAMCALRDRIIAEGSRVFACGFGPDAGWSQCGRIDRARQAMIASIPGSRRISLAADSGWEGSGSLPAHTEFQLAHDVHAEARAAAAWIRSERRAGQRILVLVQHAATERRVVAALRRIGVHATTGHGLPTAAHGAAVLARQLVPLFTSGGACPVRRAELEAWMTSPIAPPIGEEGPPMPVARQSIIAILNRARRTSATLEHWCASAATTPPGETTKRPRARIPDADCRGVLRWLRRLHAHAGSGTVRGIGAFIAQSGPPWAQAANTAITEALLQCGDPASHEALDERLGGEFGGDAVPGDVHVLRYEDYDLQPAEGVICLDVHSKGIAAPPVGDPILESAGEREAMGATDPEQVVRERLALLGRAAAQSRSCRLMLATRGADGKRVVPPLQLSLPHGGESIANHGIAEEMRLIEALAARAQGTPEHLTRHDLQVDAEWVRSDRARMVDSMPPEPDRARDPLTAWLEPDRRPEHVRPFMGLAAGATSNDIRFSPSRMELFTGCLFRGWAATVLGLKEQEVRAEDFGHDEIGSAAHRSIELAIAPTADGPRVALVLPKGADPGDVRKRFADAAAKAFAPALAEEARSRTPGVPDVELPGAAEIAARWERHWPKFAATRIQTFAETVDQRRDDLLRRMGITNNDQRKRLFDEAMPGVEIKSTAAAIRIGSAIARGLAALPTLPDGVIPGHGPLEELALQALESPARESATEASILSKALGELESAQGRPGFVRDVVEKLRAGWIPWPSEHGDRHVIAAEQTLSGGRAGAEIVLSAEVTIRLSGQIDAVARYSDGTHEIIDFKTGHTTLRENDALQRLLAPQLPLYALAALQGYVPGVPAGSEVRMVTVDRVKAERGSSHSIDLQRAEISLPQFGERLGALLGRCTRDGDFPLLPHPDRCPLSASRGSYCDFEDACRHRAAPRIAEADLGSEEPD